MRLDEVKLLKSPPAAREGNIFGLLHDWADRAYGGKKVKTSDPSIQLSVWGSPAQRTFIVFPMTKDEFPYFAPAGYVVFEWPEKLGQKRGWAKNVRSPHSGFAPALRGKGVAKMIYKWFLDAGNILVTADRQTPASNVLWKSLASDYDVVFFNEKGEFIDSPTPEQAQKRNVRMALLGKGQTKDDIFKD